jgi:hypothetical protein
MSILREKIVYAIRAAEFDGHIGCREKDNSARECKAGARGPWFRAKNFQPKALAKLLFSIDLNGRGKKRAGWERPEVSG